jgi:hypothetical protein
VLIFFDDNFAVIADAGGLLGLFLGCSALSIVELFYFFVLFVIKSITKGRRIDVDSENSFNNEKDIEQKLKDMKNHLNTLQQVVNSLVLQQKEFNLKIQKIRKDFKKFNNARNHGESSKFNDHHRDELLDILKVFDEI